MQKAKRSNQALYLSFYLGLIIAFGLWLVYIPLPSPKHPLVLYDSQNISLRSPLLTLIHEAKDKISLYSFSFDDPSLFSLLEKKRSAGCDVSLHYDRRYKRKVTKTFQDASWLTPCKAKGLVHEKVALFDTSKLILSSANLTLSSTLMHHNLSLGIYSPQLLCYWEAGTPYGEVALGRTHLEFYRLPLAKEPALKMLYQSLDEAKSSLVIAMFTFTHPQLTEKIVQAHKRGVHVTLFADHTCAKGASRKALSKLQRAGITLYTLRGLTLLHHKWALIDNQVFFFGSANWTRAAFNKNQDYLLKLTRLDRRTQKGLKKVIKRLRLACKKD